MKITKLIHSAINRVVAERRWRSLTPALLLGSVCMLGASAARAQQPYDPNAAPTPQYHQYPQQPYPQAPLQIVPPTLTVPAGTVVTARVSQFLSSDQNRPGDLFNMTFEQPLVVDGWVAVQRGQAAYGRVAVAHNAKFGKGVSELGLELSQLTLIDGQQIPVRTSLAQATGTSSTGESIATVGVATGMGAAIGAAANGGEGAGIGAAIGAAAGMLGVMFTKGKPTEIYPETILSFQLSAPIAISTIRSQQAFRPVTPQDYAPVQTYAAYPAPRQRVVAPPPVYYYPRPYYGWGYYYPGPNYRYYGYYRPAPIVIAPRFGGGERREERFENRGRGHDNGHERGNRGR